MLSATSRKTGWWQKIQFIICNVKQSECKIIYCKSCCWANSSDARSKRSENCLTGENLQPENDRGRTRRMLWGAGWVGELKVGKFLMPIVRITNCWQQLKLSAWLRWGAGGWWRQVLSFAHPAKLHWTTMRKRRRRQRHWHDERARSNVQDIS